jgi:hypothetical protein
VPGIYATGWIKRGPVGLIGHTKGDALETIGFLLEDRLTLPPARNPDPQAIIDLLEERGIEYTTWEGWNKLDAHEAGLGAAWTGPDGLDHVVRERIKVVPREDMIRISRGYPSDLPRLRGGQALGEWRPPPGRIMTPCLQAAQEFDEEPDSAGTAAARRLGRPCQLDGGALADAPGNLRSLIRESWQRSAGCKANPDNPAAPLALDRDELEDYRSQHPLAAIMPVINKLLVQPSHDSGLLVAVGDEVGRLLWVEGDPALQRRAEGMMFVAGADWSEATVGTSAPGTALALGRGIQIAGAEHYQRAVHAWSCTAVPFHDPDSGAVLGVVDITGTATAVAPHTLSLVEATVAAAQAQLRVERLQLAAELARGSSRRRATATASRAPGRAPRKAASTGTACSCWAATRPCSAWKAKLLCCPPGTAKSLPCSAPTPTG